MHYYCCFYISLNLLIREDSSISYTLSALVTSTFRHILQSRTVSFCVTDGMLVVPISVHSSAVSMSHLYLHRPSPLPFHLIRSFVVFFSPIAYVAPSICVCVCVYEGSVVVKALRY